MNARFKELAEEALALPDQIEKTNESLHFAWKEWVLAKERESMAEAAARLSPEVRALTNEKARDAQVTTMTTKERADVNAAAFTWDTLKLVRESREFRLKALLEILPVLARGE